MLLFFIHLFCTLAYFAKILESMTEKGAAFPIFTTMKYMDYVFTWSHFLILQMHLLSREPGTLE